MVARCAALLLCLSAVTALSPEDEHFTIFLDLDNYHVSKGGEKSHEFITPEQGIGEHDNVIINMSEEEMRLHMDTHGTHDCEHPADQAEIVSFIQENMYESVEAPAIIQEAIAPQL